MTYSILSHRQLLKLTGDDTETFLQGLISNDMKQLADSKMIYTALLSPQGKFLHDFFIAKWQGSYWIDCDASRMDDLRKRLTLYRLRSKVTIEVVTENIKVATVWQCNSDITTQDDILVVSDPRLSALGMRIIGHEDTIRGIFAKTNVTEASPEAYDCWRIRHAIPDGSRDMIIDKSLLLEFGFEQLNGVDFNKGCYVGQEVTARSKFRAQLKKALYLVTSESGTLPDIGTVILSGEMIVGELRSSGDGMGLAILRTAELAKANQSDFPLRAGDCVINASIPDWWQQQAA